MYRHKYFNLWLHDDEELASLIGSVFRQRVTLHEWPLSCVQRLTTADGRTVIYKSEFGPTVESEFYANARSTLLPAAKTIYESDGHVCLLIESVEGSLLEDLGLPEAELVQVGREVMAQIREITGDLPILVDISTEEKWEEFVEIMLNDLRRLTSRGKFELVDDTAIRDLEGWAFSQSVRWAIRTSPGYVHGDFAGDNIFVLPDGYRVIDWQRPKLGPTDVDLATLLESSGFDPWQHVDEGSVRVMYLLGVHWVTQCATRWFPEGTKTYDEQIARLTSLLQGPGAGVHE